MRAEIILNRKGITFIELMVALVIFSTVIAATYRLFNAQARAYAVQDQVVEVQQNIRGAMEVLLRDLRMAGCDDDNDPYKSPVIPIVTPVADHSITLNYRYYDRTGALNQVQVTYSLNGTDLQRLVSVNGVPNPSEGILSNVHSLVFVYGVDADGDGAVDGNNYVQAAAVGTNKIISIHVQLTADPSPDNPDVQKEISPRSLTSTVTLRNLL